MRVVAILQARMNSTRLPGKMLLPLCGAPLIQRVIERVQRATCLDAVVLAVPSTTDNRPLAACVNGGCKFYPYTGEEHDVVGRYLSAAVSFDADLVVRIPGDNPCVEPAVIDAAVEAYLAEPYLYYSNTVAWIESASRYVDGLGAEVCSRSRWQWLDHKTRGQPSLREHPHRYFESCGLLNMHVADLRLDVNTQADYECIRDMYEALYPTNNQFTITDILAYLDPKKVHA